MPERIRESLSMPLQACRPLNQFVCNGSLRGRDLDGQQSRLNQRGNVSSQFWEAIPMQLPRVLFLLLIMSKQGKLKLLMILADKHWPTSPNTPHMLEKGYDFFAFSYNSIIAPAGLPEPIRAKLEDSFKRALRDPSVIEMASKFQVELVGMGGKEYSAFWRSKYDEYGEIVKKLEVGGNKDSVP